MPALALRMASLTAFTASSCPTTRSWSTSSKWISFSLSPVIIFATGIPVQRLTTLAISSSPTSSFKSCSSLDLAAITDSSCCSCLFNFGSLPYFSSDIRLRSYERSAASIWLLTSSISFFIARTRKIACFSPSHLAFKSFSLACKSAFSAVILLSRSFEASSLSFFSACSSISSCIIFRRISSSGAGIDSISVRSLAAASSTKSIALSGKNLSEI